MTMKYAKFSRLTSSLISIFLIIFMALTGDLIVFADDITALAPQTDHSVQCIRILRTLEQYHYSEKKLDNALSSIIFDKYLKRLDPGKKLFTVHDIAAMKQYKFRMDDELNNGNLKPAFQIFNLYLARSLDRLDYILSLIKTWDTKFDFTKDESLVIENDLIQWQPDYPSLIKTWDKDLKNHIITMMLDEKENQAITSQLEKIYTNRKQRLLQTDSNDAFEIFMNTVTTCFDPHTQFFPPKASEEFAIHMSLSLEGIGALLQTEYEYTKVVRLIPKGPADKSNLLMPGDKIIGVGQGEDGEMIDTIGQRMDNVVKLIRGPKNTIVRLKIIPAKTNSTTKTIQIKRDEVKLEDQSAKKDIITLNYNNENYNIGVIEIPSFYEDFNPTNRGDINRKSLSHDVSRLLSELKKEKIDGLIIDLRNNGGGSLPEANLLTGLFLESGPTVQIRYKKNNIDRIYDKDPKIEYSGPLIVLINRMSASASEIFAGAIKDYNRGVIVGTRSFGKGTVQYLQPLSKERPNLSSAKLKFTSAKFYRVSGESTQHKGVLPDIEYPQFYKIEDTGESALDGALPWDTIDKTFYKAYRPLKPIYSKLLAEYQNRSRNNPELKYILKRIEMASTINDQTTISLNLNQRKSRKKEYEQMELSTENEYLLSVGKQPLEELNAEDATIKDTKKIIMDQTSLVMADLITYSRDLGFSW
ncbi:MAG: carboxy terminal-processing peptidase [Pseudomonadota bacterium]